MSLRHATEEDFARLKYLLKQNLLPLDGFPQDCGLILVSTRENGIDGCAALEIHADYGLLRSVAVGKNRQKRGLGTLLVQSALQEAEAMGLQAVYLLTETAAGFFPRFGFHPVSRESVPAGIKASVEFTTACPDTAVAMALVLPAENRHTQASQ